VYPTVNNISLSEGGTIEDFLPPSMSDRTASLASWIEISRAGINLPIGETKTVNLTLRVSHDPAPGVYHALIGFGYGRNRDESEAQVKNGQAPGTIITVTIADKKVEFLKLSRFIIDRFVTSSDNQAASYAIKNPGDIALTPSGDIILYDNRGAEVGTLSVNPDKIQIQPGEEHQFNAKVPVKGFFGKYKAFLTVEYGNSQIASVQDTVFFYVFPFKLVTSVFLIIAFLVICIALYIYKKYFDQNDMQEADFLDFHIKGTESSVALHHDIDLKQK
jgi:uncharacterized membrane protein